MRQSTSYSKMLKAQIVQKCLLPDVSIASVALRHGINANLVRKWVPGPVTSCHLLSRHSYH
ncbi:transposase [Pseudomonas fulva]|uniref:transposase n=1 Tax=Pseudomonas fulva TaxID=47880 RepID=UPI0015E4682B|nr:transposase [Pseudomonas fulva]